MIGGKFETAQRTASWCHTKPWLVHLTKGEATRRFGYALTEHANTHEPVPDLTMAAGYHGVHWERRRDAGCALYRSLGIQREDWDAERPTG